MLDRLPITQRACGRWREILPAIGVDSRLLTGKHVPCPKCGGRDRFRFDDKEGRGTWICNQCGAGDGVKLVMLVKGCDFRTAAEAIEQVIGTAVGNPAQPSSGDDARAEAARTQKRIAELVGSSRRVAEGDPVDLYLRSRVPGLKFVPAALRLLAEAEHWGLARVRTVHPAMLGIVSDAHGDRIAIHRTYLTADGHKADVDPVRMALGPLPDVCAIRLAKFTTILGVAEGIETALSAMALHRIPVWSTLNAGRLESWSPPEGVNEVIIFGDNDLNSVGQAAAFALGARLNRTITAQVAIPPEPGADWNNVLLNTAEAAA
jgi:putative DNA primase/helicase